MPESAKDVDKARRCEQIICLEEATHVVQLDLGATTEVCDEHAENFPEDMVEVL